MKPNFRRCVSCRKVAPKEEFWQIVRAYPSGQVVLDQAMGRSAYLCPQESCLLAAQKKNRLGKALKANVLPELYQVLWQRLSHLQTAVNPRPENQTASDLKPLQEETQT